MGVLVPVAISPDQAEVAKEIYFWESARGWYCTGRNTLEVEDFVILMERYKVYKVTLLTIRIYTLALSSLMITKIIITNALALLYFHALFFSLSFGLL